MVSFRSSGIPLIAAQTALSALGNVGARKYLEARKRKIAFYGMK